MIIMLPNNFAFLLNIRLFKIVIDIKYILTAFIGNTTYIARTVR